MQGERRLSRTGSPSPEPPPLDRSRKPSPMPGPGAPAKQDGELAGVHVRSSSHVDEEVACAGQEWACSRPSEWVAAGAPDEAPGMSGEPAALPPRRMSGPQEGAALGGSLQEGLQLAAEGSPPQQEGEPSWVSNFRQAVALALHTPLSAARPAGGEAGDDAAVTPGASPQDAAAVSRELGSAELFPVTAEGARAGSPGAAAPGSGRLRRKRSRTASRATLKPVPSTEMPGVRNRNGSLPSPRIASVLTYSFGLMMSHLRGCQLGRTMLPVWCCPCCKLLESCTRDADCAQQGAPQLISQYILTQFSNQHIWELPHAARMTRALHRTDKAMPLRPRPAAARGAAGAPPGAGARGARVLRRQSRRGEPAARGAAGAGQRGHHAGVLQ